MIVSDRRSVRLWLGAELQIGNLDIVVLELDLVNAMPPRSHAPMLPRQTRRPPPTITRTPSAADMVWDPTHRDTHFHRPPRFFVMHTFFENVVLDVAPSEIMEGGRRAAALLVPEPQTKRRVWLVCGHLVGIQCFFPCNHTFFR
jgi:hypothetical protein